MDRVGVDVCREWGRRVEECIWVIWNEQSRGREGNGMKVTSYVEAEAGGGGGFGKMKVFVQ